MVVIMNRVHDTAINELGGSASGAVAQAQEVCSWQAEGIPGLEFSSFKRVRRIFPAHFHDAYEFVLVREGAVCIDYRRTRWVAPTGSFYAFQPEEVQADRPLENFPYTSLCALIEVPLALELMREIVPERADGLNLTDFFLPNACALLFEELCNSFWDSASALERESNLLLFVAELLPHTSGQSSKGTEPKAVALIKDYLRNHFYAKVTLADLSKLTGLSRYHLLRTFKNVVGISPHGFLTSLRIGQARTLLRDQVLIKEVARRAGFADQAHLSRLFKRYTGTTPSRYQQVGTFKRRHV